MDGARELLYFPSRTALFRELKQQTFFRRRRQPDVNFTSVSRFPPTWSAVATRRRLCFAYFDVACKTRGLRCYFRVFMSFCTDIFARIRCLRYYSIILDVVLAVSWIFLIFRDFLTIPWRLLERNNSKCWKRVVYYLIYSVCLHELYFQLINSSYASW